MKKISRLAAPLTLTMLLAVPLVAAAQAGINVGYIKNYSDSITNIINYMLVPALMALAFIVFLWGVYMYFIQGAADEASRATGRQFTLWGIIGFVIIVTLWGIVNLFMNTLGLTSMSAPPTPTIGNTSSGVQSATGNPFGTVSPATNAALTQQYTQVQNTCNTYGAASSQCQQAQTSYATSYNASYPSSDTSGGTTGASCVGSGQSTCAPGYTCSGAGELSNFCEPVSGSGSTAAPTTSGIPPGGDCTSNPNGCENGLYCVPGDTGSVCSSSSSGGGISGCTNQNATNWNSSATTNDGSCTCIDPTTNDLIAC